MGQVKISELPAANSKIGEVEAGVQSGVTVKINPNLTVDSNNLQVQKISDAGIQSHFPIYHFESSENLTLSATAIDQIFVNDLSDAPNSISLQDESGGQIYADNATFYAINSSGTTLTIQALGSAIVDGGASITVANGCGLKISRYSLNTWVSDQLVINNNVFNAVVGTSGITITQDSQGRSVFSLTGTGATSGYGYFTTTGANSAVSFVDQAHWLIPWSTNVVLVNRSSNFQLYTTNPAGNGLTGVQYIGTDSVAIEVEFDCAFAFNPGNMNAASNDYQLGVNLNLTGASGGSYAPIDQVGSGPQSGTWEPFTVFPNYQTITKILFQVTVNPGDILFPLVINRGPSNTPSLNFLALTKLGITAKILGDVGGTSAGVQSFNDETGVVTTPYSAYTPSISTFSGATFVTAGDAFYEGITLNPGGIITVKGLQLTLQTDTSSDLVQVSIPLPIGISPNFTADAQAKIMDFEIIPTTGLGSPGNIGSGWINGLIADTASGNQVILTFETAQISTSYLVTVSFCFQIQPTFRKPSAEKLR